MYILKSFNTFSFNPFICDHFIHSTSYKIKHIIQRFQFHINFRLPIHSITSNTNILQ